MTRKASIPSCTFSLAATLVAVFTLLVASTALAWQSRTGMPSKPKAAPSALDDSLFLPVVTYETGGTGSSFPFGGNRVAVADVNGDGVPDLIAANWCTSATNCSTGSVAVLIGNGDGTFKPAINYSSGGYYSFSVLVADINGDGRPDLVVGNGCATLGSLCPAQSSVGILLGNGDGSFKAVRNYDTGGSVVGIAVADLNADGRSDVIVADCGPVGATCFDVEGLVAVLLGNSDGTLSPAATYDSGGKVASTVTVADVNGDGKPDVLVGNLAACNTVDNCGNGSVGVLLGNGDGTLRPVVTFNSLSPYSVVVQDLNGDGKLDLITTTTNAGGSVSILLGNGDGTFQTVTSYLLDAQYQSPAVISDVNGDSIPDILVGSLYCQHVAFGSQGCASVLLGKGDGTFQHVVTYDTGAVVGGWLAVADIDADGRLDLVVANICNNKNCKSSLASVFLGNGDGNFQAARTYSSGVSSSWVGISDLNHDGRPDLIIADPAQTDFQVGVLLNNTSHLLVTSTSLTSSPNPSVAGQTVTFTATVTSSSGPPPNGEIVTFYNGPAILGTSSLTGGVATLATSSLGVGTYTITATYVGDSNLATSTSPGLKQYVNSKSATSTSLASNLNPSTYGQKVTFTATVTNNGGSVPTGKVTFTWSIYTIGTATLNASGVASLTKANLNVQNFPITAVYKGDTNNLGSTSAVLNQVVNQATSTATLTSAPNPSTVGQAVTFTAKITSPTVKPTGPVTFTAGNTVLGTVQLTGGKATLTTSSLSSGSTVVTVTYNGNSNIKGSSASVTQVVQ